MTARDDATDVARLLSSTADGAKRLHQATEQAAQAGLARVKANASGRPGPRRITGDYTRSMNVNITHPAGNVSAEIGTNAAQALRLEFGFHGTDRIGRHYNQRPLPHWRPMWEWVEGFYFQAAEQAVSGSFQ